LIIAHRWGTVQCTDRVLMLHRGELIEQGTHAELLAGNGYYAWFYQAATLEPSLTHGV